jgi:hypothetical protein
MMPRALYGVGVVPGARMNELDTVVNSLVLVTLRTDIAVRAPKITNDRGAGFDPVTYNGHQFVDGSVLDGNKKCFAGNLFHTATIPLEMSKEQKAPPPRITSPNRRALPSSCVVCVTCKGGKIGTR